MTNKKIKILYRTICIFEIIAFVLVFFGTAFATRQELIDKYNNGVQYFENGDYEDAILVFNDLQGWGRDIVPISPEDYCQMAMDRLKNEGWNAIKCPYCNKIITEVNG